MAYKNINECKNIIYVMHPTIKMDESVPRWFVPRWSSKPSLVNLRSAQSRDIPALLIKMSIVGYFDFSDAAHFRMEETSDKSNSDNSYRKKKNQFYYNYICVGSTCMYMVS